MTKEITIKDELTEFLLYTSPNGDVKVEAFLNIFKRIKKMDSLEIYGKGARNQATKIMKGLGFSLNLGRWTFSKKFMSTFFDVQKLDGRACYSKKESFNQIVEYPKKQLHIS